MTLLDDKLFLVVQEQDKRRFEIPVPRGTGSSVVATREIPSSGSEISRIPEALVVIVEAAFSVVRFRAPSRGMHCYSRMVSL